MNKLSSIFSLEGKTFLVTGASSGIGKQIAITLSYHGATIILSGRNLARLEATHSQLNGNSHKIFAGDICTEETLNRIALHVPPLDGIVYAAGIMKLLPFKFIKGNELRDLMDSNFFSPIELTLLLFKEKKIKNNASLVFITSINGAVIGSKANSMYAASKGALTGMIKSMALDLSKNKIRVNNIAPGMIETEGVDEIKNTVSEQAINDDVLKYPLGSYGTPSDVANGCLYLLSDASRWVTGITLVIDGGFTIQ